MKLQTKNGFTLIELIIVIAIVGILAAIAYPSYQEQVRHSRRSDCAGALVGLASAMERDFTARGSYRDITAAALGLYPDACPIDGGTETYDLTVAIGAGNNTYTLTAAPKGPQSGDKCANLTLTNTAQKGTSSSLTVSECW